MKNKSVFKYIKENLDIIVVFLLSSFLRLVNLGYSDYQGDEIKAFYLPKSGQSLSSFLMNQKKGPVQFLITYVIKIFDPLYENQFFTRLPFAIAGIFAVVFFYKFVKIHFGNKIAFYSSLFFATNGFFIAFSRIVQYQSFVILFAILCLYFLSLANEDKKYRLSGIYLGLLCWAISILSHYDGVFIFPFVFYLLFKWFRNPQIVKKDKILTFVSAGIISAGLLATFYFPFFRNIGESTTDYWSSRISGVTSGKISSSKYLFRVYQPIYALQIYFILAALGGFFIVLGFFSDLILKIKKLPSFVTYFFSYTTDIMRSISKDKLRIICLFLWIFINVIFLEKYVYISGTHIYNYIIPSFILLGFGIVAIESFIFKIFEIQLVKIFNFLGIFLVFLFLTAQSYAIFINNEQEYPWENKNFLIWTLRKPDESYHLSLFGFPYYRDWEGIRNFAKLHPELQAYSTNEKKEISSYYLKFDRNYEKSGIYVYVKSPQSFIEVIENEKAAYWVEKYDPAYTLTRNGSDRVRVYMMEPGTLEEIIKKGF